MSYNMSSSSSEDSWPVPAKPAASTSAASGEAAMLAARRRAFHQQQQRAPVRANTSAAVPGRLGSRNAAQPPHESESSLPSALLGSDTHSDDGGPHDTEGAAAAPSNSLAAAALPAPRGEVRAAAAAAPPPPLPVASPEDALQELRRQVEAKRRVLQATRDREAALRERWRAAKAQKNAELRQLDGQLRDLWAANEDAKSGAAAAVQRADDEREQQLRAARQETERRLRADYDAKLAELGAQLEAKRAEETRLKAQLSEACGTEDVVQTAIAAAVSGIVEQLQQDFAQRTDDVAAWEDELRARIAQEVRASFAVSVDSEAAAERQGHARSFDDMLAGWREAEATERARLEKMDDALLADLQAMAQEDVRRLQQEELTMTQLYVDSREAWLEQQQQLLQRQVEAATTRLTAEFETQRELRHQLHVDRLRDLERRHKDQLAMEEALHEREMQQLREGFAKEEALCEERRRVQLATQQDMAAATEGFEALLGQMDDIVRSLQNYQATVDGGFATLREAQQTACSRYEERLQALQAAVTTECGELDKERRSLGDAVAQLGTLQAQLDQHLQEETSWLTQQEAQYGANKDAWAREHCRWRQLVVQERQQVQARFADALVALQEGLGRLSQEEREVAAEASEAERTLQEMNDAIASEEQALREREAQLQEKYDTNSATLASLQTVSAQTAEAWSRLQRERAQLVADKAELKASEGKLRAMALSLKAVKAQVAEMRAHTAEVTAYEQRVRLQAASAADKPSAPSREVRADQRSTAIVAPHAHSHPKHPAPAARPDGRLAAKVLREMRAQLQAAPFAAELPPWRPPPAIEAPPATKGVAARPSTSRQARTAKPAPSPQGRRTQSLEASPLPRSPGNAGGVARAREVAAVAVVPTKTAAEPTPERVSPRSRAHADPSPRTQASSPLIAMEASGQASQLENNLSCTGNTFTNLIGFSDIDTVSQSFQTS